MVPRPLAAPLKTITGVMNSMNLQQASRSTSYETVVTPKLKPVPNSVNDSCTLDLHEADFLPSNRGKIKSTPKRNIPEIPGLQWWFECCPAGYTIKDLKRVVLVLRTSVTPIKMTATYHVPGTAVRRELTDTVKAIRKLRNSISHSKILTKNSFKTGPIKLCCDIVVHTASIGNPQPVEQPLDTIHTYAKRKHFNNPSYIITTSKRKIADDIEWFITSTPGGKDFDGNGCLTVYLNASTNVSGNVKYEIEGTHLQGDMAFSDSALIQIKQILHTDLDAYPLIEQFDIKIVATLGASSRNTTPTTSSGSAESDSSEWESTDDEDDFESGMTDKELLLHRLKMQEEETNKVLELLKKSKPIIIADGADFL